MAELQAQLNKLAGSVGFSATAAANKWAGSQGLSLVGALNRKAGTIGLGFNAVCNRIAGKTGLGGLAALNSIASTVNALRSAGTRGNPLGQGTQVPPAGLSVTYRTQCVAPQDYSDIGFGFGNYRFTGAGAVEIDGANPITVKCAIEYPAAAAPGVRTPLYFGGNRAIEIAPGTRAKTDLLPIPGNIKKGDTFYVWTNVSVASSGMTFPIGLQAAASLAAAAGSPYPFITSTEANNFTENTGDVTLTGSVVARNGNSYSPVVIFGTPVTPQPTVAIIGDSIASGFTDVLLYDFGYIVRALANNNVPYINLAHKGETASQFSSLANSSRRRAFLEYATHAIVNYGTNDLAALSSFVATATNLQTIWQSLAALGLPVYQTTITPRTTSTDSWATTANQTIVNGCGQPRTDLNNWLRAGAPVSGGVPVAPGTAGAVPSPYLTGVFDICPAVETGVGLWKPGLTPDGVHPNTAGHTAMAALIQTAPFISGAQPKLAGDTFSRADGAVTATEIANGSLGSLPYEINSGNPAMTVLGGLANLTGGSAAIDVGKTKYSIEALLGGTNPAILARYQQLNPAARWIEVGVSGVSLVVDWSYNSLVTYAAIPSGSLVKVIVNGDSFTLLVNGAVWSTFTTSYLNTSTKCGFRGDPGTVDNFAVYALP